MGIYEREYYRDEPGGFRVRKPGTVIGWILLANIAVFLVEQLTGGADGRPVYDLLKLQADDLIKPWYWWRFLTYGFVHAPFDLWHIIGNMLGLFFLGPPVEQRYGGREFLRIYLVTVVFAGVVWAASNLLQGNPGVSAVGASGGVVGIVILFALNYPKQTVLFMFAIPMPAWVLGVLLVVGDLYSAMNPESTRVAFEAHLAGAGLALLYFRGGWNFTRWTEWIAPGKLFNRQPRLKVHHPDDDDGEVEVVDKKKAAMEAEVDRILEKIGREGEASLSRKERRTLQSASRQYQEKHRDSPSD